MYRNPSPPRMSHDVNVTECTIESIGFQARKMDADFQFGLPRGKVRATKNNSTGRNVSVHKV